MTGVLFPQDVIIRKRDGGRLSRAEIESFVQGAVSGTWQDYQTTALLMAIVWRGLDAQETAWLTEAMLRSGAVIDLSDIPGAKVDKHSTGGVGDKVSLILAPLAAAAGLRVPMMSGRGLGHTGGTLDKLEAIPGFRTGLTVDEFRRLVATVGLAMISQTAEVVPADRKLYALRDVTGTVESIPLICASIMSKKLAEGIDALVLDVKFGRGAFMRELPRARELAAAMVAIGRATGRPVRALLTAMDQPLGRAVGHSVEVAESIDCLRGRGPADLMEVTLALTRHMLLLGGAARDEADAAQRLERALASGAALEKFRAMVAAQGGDPRVVDEPSRLPAARHQVAVTAPADAAGFIQSVDALAIGRAAMRLGAGRAHAAATIDLAVGFTDLVKVGQPVAPGSRLATIHANDPALLHAVAADVHAAIQWGPSRPGPEPLVREILE